MGIHVRGERRKIERDGSGQGLPEGCLLVLLPGHYALEYANTSSAFSLPVFWVRIQPFQHVKRLCSMPEVAHLVTVISYQLQQVKRLGRCLHLQVQLPGLLWLLVHYVWNKNNYQISREKYEPEPGFQPRTSGSLARHSTTSYPGSHASSRSNLPLEMDATLERHCGHDTICHLLAASELTSPFIWIWYLNQIIKWKQTCNLCLGKFTLSDLKRIIWNWTGIRTSSGIAPG